MAGRAGLAIDRFAALGPFVIDGAGERRRLDRGKEGGDVSDSRTIFYRVARRNTHARNGEDRNDVGQLIESPRIDVGEADRTETLGAFGRVHAVVKQRRTQGDARDIGIGGHSAFGRCAVRRKEPQHVLERAKPVGKTAGAAVIGQRAIGTGHGESEAQRRQHDIPDGIEFAAVNVGIKRFNARNEALGISCFLRHATPNILGKGFEVDRRVGVAEPHCALGHAFRIVCDAGVTHSAAHIGDFEAK